ncbi:DUF480 domain-containing protein [Paraconexibacter algicola]|uniref:DUF480 domain-containing protein n=1 Tax=Paraconexibacter algicola TaxID=2133960 RepID=UPI001304F5C7|nr:DUF480 domain-containing protein [Paraconexibacter algicola]
MDPDAVELRVLGCLIEKQRTTPDQYPLSLNALRLACNQSTNRDPVVDYDEHTVREAAQRLGRRRWSRLASSSSSRTAKYRHLLDEALGIGQDELALLGVLLLRGPQTPGELKARSERLHRFADLDELLFTLQKLIGRGHVAKLERRPGQKEERYVQLLGGEEEAGADTTSVAGAPAPVTTPGAAVVSDAPTPAPTPVPTAAPAPADDARVAALEAQVARLQDDLAAVRGELRALREELGA